MSRKIHAAPVAAALVLALAAPNEADAQDSSSITTVWESLIGTTTENTESMGIGYAMSALGIAGPSDTQLSEISGELSAIYGELVVITEYLNAIQLDLAAGNCESDELAILDDVSAIQTWYATYSDFVTNAAGNKETNYVPVPPSQSEVNAWVTEVTVGALPKMETINGAVIGQSENMLKWCNNIGGDGTTTLDNFMNDQVDWEDYVTIINYYMATMIQGATMLVEAYHLKACQATAESDPNWDCDFTTSSESASASDPAAICDSPVNVTVSQDCTSAVEAVIDPNNNDAYTWVTNWWLKAGAPYATGEVGILRSSIASQPTSWNDDYAYLLPIDLFDFTNNATVNGSTLSDCSDNLTSTDPCGFLVGAYDHKFPEDLKYGGFANSWRGAEAEILALLFEPFNKKATGFDVSGDTTAASYMDSIGFESGPQSESQSDTDGFDSSLIILTADTGKNGDLEKEAICFMDTEASRGKTKLPWCDSNSNSQSTNDLLVNHNCGSNAGGFQNAGFTDDLSLEEFYTGHYCFDTNEWNNGKAPYWFLSVQESSTMPALAAQFHLPQIDVAADIDCQQGGPDGNTPYTATYLGLLSRCGDDLQAYIDAILPPPDPDQTQIMTAGDTTLESGAPNRNTGAAHILRAGPHPEHAFVVRFSDDRIQRFVEDGDPSVAILRLSVAGRHGSTRVEIVPLEGGFAESRATLNCAEDADAGDHIAECVQTWQQPIFPGGQRWRHHERKDRRPVHYDRRRQLVSWDVTEDVAAGYSAWLIRAHHARASIFHSKEGAAELAEFFRAPTLLLERDTDDSLVWDDHDVRDGGRWRHRGRHHRRWRDARFDERRAD